LTDTADVKGIEMQGNCKPRLESQEERTQLIEVATFEWWQVQEFPKVALKQEPSSAGPKANFGSSAAQRPLESVLVMKAA